MQISLNELAQLLNGEVVGDGKQMVHTVAKIEEGFSGALSFLANTKYEEFLYSTKSSGVLVNKGFEPNKPYTTTLIKVDDAYAAFTYLLEKFSNVSNELKGIEAMSFVDPSAKVGEGVYIGSYAYVAADAVIADGAKIYPQVYIGKGVKVGKNTILYPGVKVYHACEIGDNCIIHAGSIIGSDGFGFAPLPDRSYKKIPQTGNVIIQSEVEIGANCTVDRATMGSTIVKQGVKLDNMVQIAHNVEVGPHTVMASQSGIAGSSKVGGYCVIGGQVGIAGHLTVADGNQFGGQTGQMVSIKEPYGKWFGTPSMDVKDNLRSAAIYRKLPSLLKRIEDLEKEIKKLKG
jgi:UDP-3-O-[3-hydroxymyristoyl] glucosamine N-acyltransferase